MYKVQIDSDGSVLRDLTKEKIGTMPKAFHADLKEPNTFKSIQVRLLDGTTAILCYGGFSESKTSNGPASKTFIESCHAHCPSNNRHCFLFGTSNCPFGKKLKDVGFYVI